MGIAEDLLILETRLKELITLYEKYFAGVEKREPVGMFADVERMVRRYANTSINNTMYKHRYNTLVARFNSYRQHWNRILREIEEGRYSRDRFRADLNEGRKSPSPSTDKVPQRSSYEIELDRVYAELVKARRNCKLPVDGLSRKQLAETLEKQRPVISQKLGSREIQFRVVIENGKPKIKAGLKHKTSED